MKQNKTPLSIRVIYWVTNFSYWLSLIIILLSVVLNILFYTNFFDNSIQLHAELPVKVDFNEIGSLHLNNKDIKVELVSAKSKIHFIDTPNFILKGLGIIMLIISFATSYLIWTFRTFIKNVKDGSIFTIRNISILKKLAYGIVAFWLFAIIYTRLFYYYIAKNLKFENIKITDDIPNYSEILFIALFIWVLAHIFITGLKLQEEKDLTI